MSRERKAKTKCCPDIRLLSYFFAIIFLAASATLFPSDIMSKYEFSFPGYSVSCGEPFYLTVDLMSRNVDLRDVYVEIPPEYVLDGGYDELSSYYGRTLSEGKIPRPFLRILSTDLLVNEAGKKVFRMLLNGTAEGILNFTVVLSDDETKYSEEKIPIRFEIPKEKVRAFENRMEIIDEKMESNSRFAKENYLGTDYFGCSMPSSAAVIAGDQYIIHHMAARKVNPSENLKYDISYYYPPLYSKTEPLSYLPTYVLKLGDSYYVIREDILIIKTTPVYDSEAEPVPVKIYHPQVNWLTQNDEKYVSESFSNEFEQVTYLKPEKSIPVINGMKASVSVENDSVRTGEYNVLSIIIESESIMLDQPLKISINPQSVETVEMGGRIEKIEELKTIKYVYNYDYTLKSATPTEVEISIGKFEFFDLKSGATATVLPYSFVYEVLPSPVAEGDSEIYLGLNGLREYTSEHTDRKKYEYGILAYENGKTDEALFIFESLADEYFNSSDVHYNLGVIYSDLGRLYESQVEFYRSALLNPTDDVVQNIELLQKHYFLSGQKIYRFFRMDVPLILILVIFASLSFVLSVFFSRRKMRRTFVLFLLGSIFLGCFCLFILIGTYSNPVYAVVSHRCPLYSGPGYDYPEFRDIPAGNVVHILEDEGAFSKVLLNDGIYYWIDVENLQFVFLNGVPK